MSVCEICLTCKGPRFHSWMNQHFMLFCAVITVRGILDLGNILHIDVKTELVT